MVIATSESQKINYAVGIATLRSYPKGRTEILDEKAAVQKASAASPPAGGGDAQTDGGNDLNRVNHDTPTQHTPLDIRPPSTICSRSPSCRLPHTGSQSKSPSNNLPSPSLVPFSPNSSPIQPRLPSTIAVTSPKTRFNPLKVRQEALPLKGRWLLVHQPGVSLWRLQPRRSVVHLGPRGWRNSRVRRSRRTQHSVG